MLGVGVFIAIDDGVITDPILHILQRVHCERGDGRPSQVRVEPRLQPLQHLFLGTAGFDQQMQGRQIFGRGLIFAPTIDDQLTHPIINGGCIADLSPGAIGRELAGSDIGATGRELGTHQRRACHRVDVQVQTPLAREFLRQPKLRSFGAARAFRIGGRTLDGHHP